MNILKIDIFGSYNSLALWQSNLPYWSLNSQRSEVKSEVGVKLETILGTEYMARI